MPITAAMILGMYVLAFLIIAQITVIPHRSGLAATDLAEDGVGVSVFCCESM